MLTRTRPTQRQQQQQPQQQQPQHPVLIGAPRDLLAQPRPLILQRSDDDFIEATLADLRSAAGRQQLLGQRAQAVDAKGVLKLFQPIQRQFHLALIEAWCDAPGTPRIDPARVHSAGLVLRRLDAQGRPEGWMKSQGRWRGWQLLARLGGAQRDPAAALRLQRRSTGVAGIDRAIAASAVSAAASIDESWDEQVIPLYLAPPDVNADAGKTLLYGLVPTTSGELSEAPPALGDESGNDFGPATAAFNQHLVEALRGEGQSLPFAGQAVRGGWFDASEMATDSPPIDITPAQWAELRSGTSSQARAMQRFLLLLRQLSGEFNAFDGGADVAALQAQLRAIRLPLVLREGDTAARTVTAFDCLRDATTLLLAKEALPYAVEMPAVFPALDATAQQGLKAALHSAMIARFSAMKGRAGRFDEPAARYLLRAFVRIKSDCGMAPRTVWSEDSEPFTIAAWYEGAGAPPVQIALPDASDRKLLKQLKPNVAFIVPPSMQNLLSGKTKDLMEGKGSVGGPGLSWICGFNIPVITICAFIVLNIFLTLLNLVFGWLFFIKVCVPFPKIGNKPPGGA